MPEDQEQRKPLSTFEGTLRQLHLSAVSPLERKVFDYAFPTFNEAPVLNPTAEASLKKGGRAETPYNYRRFAGGPELPRGCYATVSGDGSGRDNETLVCELTYYADARKSGEVHVFEGYDPLFTAEGAGRLGVFPGYRPAPGSIVVAFVSRPNAPHPLLVPEANPLGDREACAAFRKSAPQSNQGVILLEVPTRVGHVRHEGVFDLRRLESQTLLNKWAREKLYNTVFIYSKPFDGPPPIDLNELIGDYPRAWVMTYAPHTNEPAKPIPVNALTSLALSAGENDDGSFMFLLPFLLFPGRGGSPVTEAIGAALRMGGVRGLVYPSARNDIVCRWKGDVLKEHSGWCFVDYSAFDLARPYYRLIRDPSFWIGRDDLLFSSAPPDSLEVGSWMMFEVRDRMKREHAREVEAWYGGEREKVMRRLTKRWWQVWIR